MWVLHMLRPCQNVMWSHSISNQLLPWDPKTVTKAYSTRTYMRVTATPTFLLLFIWLQIYLFLLSFYWLLEEKSTYASIIQRDCWEKNRSKYQKGEKYMDDHQEMVRSWNLFPVNSRAKLGIQTLGCESPFLHWIQNLDSHQSVPLTLYF